MIAQRWHRRSFKIALHAEYARTMGDSGARTGLTRGVFGIHRQSRGCYVLTHLPSGQRIAYRDTEAGAKALAVELVGLPVDWESAKPAMDSETRERVLMVVR